MGRQDYLRRLALGRSPFQTLETSESGEVDDDSDTCKPVPSTNNVPSQSQVLDRQVHSVRAEVNARKSQLRRAENEVLALVGVCHKVDESERAPKPEDTDDEQRALVESEHGSGSDLAIFSDTITCLLEPWALNIRQRLQACEHLHHTSLRHIIALDWGSLGPARFLAAGAASSWLYDSGQWFSQEYKWCIFGDLYWMIDDNVPERYHKVIDISIELTTFLLTAPLEVYATLQRLNIAPFWPLLPSSRTYAMLLSHLVMPARSTGLLTVDTHRVLLLALFAVRATKWKVAKKLGRYFVRALPRPEPADSLSFDGLPDESYTGSNPTLTSEDRGQDFELKGPQALLAEDLQSIGRNWQMFYDTCVGAWRRLFPSPPSLQDAEDPAGRSHSRRSSLSTPRELPEDLREAMETMETAPNSGSLTLPESSSPTGDVLGLPPDLQDLLDPMPGSQPSEGLAPQRGRHQSPMPLSRLLQPDLPRQGPSTAPRTGIFTEEIADATQLSPPDSPASNASTPLSPTDRRRNSSREADVAVQDNDPSDNPPVNLSMKQHWPAHHRVTILSSFSSMSMGSLLATHLTDLMFLPLEALFVRSVAVAFSDTPGLPWAGSARSGLSYPRGAWFGLGLRAGGWKAVRDYGGKMFLIWGLQVGTSFVLWELCTQYAWYAGRRYYDWGNIRGKE